MIFFLSDIFGVTDIKKKVWQDALNEDIQFISPYQMLDTKPIIKNYSSFMELVGLDKYSNYIWEKITKTNCKQIVLIGESVGATALWMLSMRFEKQCDVFLFCLYGSRIRDYLHIKPKCNVNLYFSLDESVLRYSEKLKILKKNNIVKINFLNLRHGFATPGNECFSSSPFNEIVSEINGVLSCRPE